MTDDRSPRQQSFPILPTATSTTDATNGEVGEANPFTYPPARVAHRALSTRLPVFEAALIQVTIHVFSSAHAVLIVGRRE